MRARRFPGLVVAAALAGLAPACVPTTPPPPAAPGPGGSTGPSGPGPAAPSGSPESAPPAPASPLPVPVLPATAVEARQGSTALSLMPGPSDSVDPGATFEVRLGLAARGARLVLLDGRDAMVPSGSDAEVGGGGSRFTLVPLEPLTPGSRYVLRLEGLESRMVNTDDGRGFEPLAVPFRVAGEPPPAPPKKAKKKRSR